MQKIRRIYLSAASLPVLLMASMPQGLAAQPEKGKQISNWINTESIAVDPVLLSTENLDDQDIDNLLSTIPRANNKTSFKKTQSVASALEAYYAERLGNGIEQFGYDVLGQTNAAKKSPHLSGDVQDDYILGNGDEVSVLIRGQQNISRTVQVTSDGQLVIEDLAPISVTGRTIKSVRDELESMLGDYYNTDVFLSLSKTRQIVVTVSGNVANPGDVTLSSFGTIMDALNSTGGILKTGTLRQIKLMRNGGSTVIDLYGVLIYGSKTSNLSLRNGDMIQIGPIGPTVAISGAVKRPAIYEILPARQTLWNYGHNEPEARSQKLSLDDLMTFAGGTIAPGNLRYIRVSPDERGHDNTSDIEQADLKIFGDGDTLIVGKGQERRADSVELLGHTRADGVYALGDTPTLSHLLSSDAILGPDIYPLIGVIERWNQRLLSKELIAFSPKQIISGASNIGLKESDRVYLFSVEEIKSIGSPVSADQKAALKLASLNTATETDAEEDRISTRRKIETNMKDFLLEHAAFIRGSIRNSGSYPIAEDTTLDALLAVAGGASLEASLDNVEITQPLADEKSKRVNINLNSTPANRITLHPGDTIRINQKFRRIEDNHVLLVGEVRNPGTYDLLPGDTLGKLIERAGGITEQAYPEGTIFSRKSERLREEQRFKSTAQDLELKLTTALSQKDKDKKPDEEEVAVARELISNLKNSEALGRLTVEADPGMLKANPDLDILLETGDRVFIPKRPLTVRVAGEVLSPASLQFRTGKNPRNYIDEAGGFSYNADQDRAFVVYPDGSAQPLSVSAWNQKATMIPPGSTIIVPRDPKPLTFMDGAKDLSQILANLATTAIFADDIANDR